MTIQGAFVWYDLMTSDMAAAEAFYAGVIGWNAEDSGMPDTSYTLFRVGDRPMAGLMTLPQDAKDMGVPPCWTGYVAVADVDKAAAAYQADGGVVRKGPMDIPGVGRFAVAADPQGAALCLFKGQGEAMAPLALGTPGSIGWHELMTSDLEAGFAFYAKQFSWTRGDGVDMGDMGLYQLFVHDGEAVGGMMKRPPHLPVSYWGYYFNVEDIHAAVGKVTSGGGQVLNGPMPVPGGQWVANCRDPQGAYFSVVAAK